MLQRQRGEVRQASVRHLFTVSQFEMLQRQRGEVRQVSVRHVFTATQVEMLQRQQGHLYQITHRAAADSPEFDAKQTRPATSSGCGCSGSSSDSTTSPMSAVTCTARTATPCSLEPVCRARVREQTESSTRRPERRLEGTRVREWWPFA